MQLGNPETGRQTSEKGRRKRQISTTAISRTAGVAVLGTVIGTAAMTPFGIAPLGTIAGAVIGAVIGATAPTILSHIGSHGGQEETSPRVR